ncbi:hypothetical protein [Mucilaginibacter paludis]|uniref:Uncharacterized protein n=1 Tax=Mucilaginibacter paludis DSM 18603 TaxID=714943 RepID=H1YHA1_9SPHI|nr:hypothetical protein [Mucilaginibacter paludis]EHQ24603.1 hypothetical protein Mucpa_0409 [Mucilaginibacter paludis DSM 18603]
MNDKIIAFSKSNPTIILSIITAYGYFCAYFYQAGTCAYYHIPTYFIDLQIIDVVKFTASISGVAIYTLWQLNGVIYNTHSITKKSLKRVMFQINFACFAILNIISISIHLPGIFYLYALGGIALLNIPFYFIARQHKAEQVLLLAEYRLKYPGHPDEDLIATIVADRNQNRNTLSEIFQYLVYWGIAIPVICGGFGYGSGTLEKTYLTVKQYPHYVVVKKYGENVLCKNLLKSNVLGDSLRFFKLSADKPLDGTIITINK